MRWIRLSLLVCLAALFGCSDGPKPAGGSLLSTGSPAANDAALPEPGETQPLPRPYVGAPPVVPHAVDGLAIRRGENACLDCHATGEEVATGHVATRVPASHYEDRFTGKKGAEIVNARFACLQCHVPQSPQVPPYALNR